MVNMKRTFLLVAVSAVAAGGVASADPHEPTRKGKIELTGSGRVRGKIDAQFKPEHEDHEATAKLRIKVKGLVKGGTYTIWGTDPATATLTQFGTVTAKGGGNVYVKLDTKHGDSLPFGATLDDLAGGAIEIRDDAGNVVLSGNFPDVVAKAAHEHDKVDLVADVSGAKGRIEAEFKPAEGKHEEESKLSVKIEHLSGDTEYTLWGTNPATATVEQFGSVTTKHDGNAEFKVETKKGDALPFGASLAALAGGTFEVRDGSGTVVLHGTFPEVGGSAPPPPPPPPPPTDETGHADLTPVSAGASGTIDTEAHADDGVTPASSTITVTLAGLLPSTNYSIWTLNPTTLALEPFGTVATDASGQGSLVIDTTAGGTLPFGVSLDALAGGSFEVHDPAAVVVLTGTFPSTQ